MGGGSGKPLTEINLTKALEQLELTMDEFIDLCILSGCDYTSTIRNLGPVQSLKMIKEYKTIEKVLEHIEEKQKDQEKKRFIVPENFDFVKA